jgi:hypothetical protein
MHFEPEACTPPSRRSRSLAWLAAASGLALSLFIFGTPGAATSPRAEPAAVNVGASGARADHLTTGSIVQTAPVRVVKVPAAHGQMLPLPQSERHLLIVLLLVCFVVMAAGSFTLWKRDWQELLLAKTTDHR